MELFEINEYGFFTDYQNGDRKVSEITMSDNVKYNSDSVFNEYQNIHTVMLPIIKYRGVTFKNSFYMINIFEMIRDKDYSCVLSHNLKYPVILQIYFNDGDGAETAYVKKNFRKVFIFYTEKIIKNNKYFLLKYRDIKNASEIMEKLIKSGKFITKRNINTYIKLADEKECYEVFDMLEEYREENLK